MSDITLEHIKAIVDGAAGRLEERVNGLQSEMASGFKGTHRRIDEQAGDIRDLATEVKETNGKVRDLRSDVDRSKTDIAGLESSVDEIRNRDTERSVEMVDLRELFLDIDGRKKRQHQRSGDRETSAHARSEDSKPITWRDAVRYWKVISGTAFITAGGLLWLLTLLGKLP